MIFTYIRNRCGNSRQGKSRNLIFAAVCSLLLAGCGGFPADSEKKTEEKTAYEEEKDIGEQESV